MARQLRALTAIAEDTGSVPSTPWQLTTSYMYTHTQPYVLNESIN